MVSFQTPFSEPELLHNQTQIVSNTETTTNSKKRKSCYDIESAAEEMISTTYRHSKGINFFSDVDLHLETPLPSEWQRCLDIQSGEIHFYNTRTHKRTARDPRARATPVPSTPPKDDNDYGYMRLDLELNLLCGSPTSEKANPPMMSKKSNKYGLRESLTLTEEGDDQGMEMMATVCMQCHMLVMLCKSSPTCPNCKFLHPPYQPSSADLFKPRLRLSC